MKLIEVIEKSYMDQDWELLNDAYEKITGERLVRPTIEVFTDADLAMLDLGGAFGLDEPAPEATVEESSLAVSEDVSENEYDSNHAKFNNYHCTHCGHYCYYEGKRKKCPECGKHKLVKLEEPVSDRVVEEVRKLDEEEVATVKDPMDFSITHDGEKNEDGKRAAQKMPFRKGTQFKNTLGVMDERWQDDGMIAHAERISLPENQGNKNLAPPPKPNRKPSELRGNQTSGKVKVKCCMCPKVEEVSPSFALGYDPDPEHNTYKCNDCISQLRKSSRE